MRMAQFLEAGERCRTLTGAWLVVCMTGVKATSFEKIKQQEARSRRAAIREARANPQAAARLQKRASLVGDAAKSRITNLNEVARAIARWD